MHGALIRVSLGLTPERLADFDRSGDAATGSVRYRKLGPTTTTCTLKRRGKVCGDPLPAEEVGKFVRCLPCRRMCLAAKKKGKRNRAAGRMSRKRDTAKVS